MTTRTPHVWIAHLPAAVPELAQASATLSNEEHEAAARFRFDADRHRYVRTRSLLRRLLAERLGIAPQVVPIAAGLHGRPIIAADSPAAQTSFSVSHAGDWALIGIAHDRRIGVDLELVRDVPEMIDIASREFTRREFGVFQRTEPARIPHLFHWFWTRKEACLKAIGLGIPGGLDRFDVWPEESENADQATRVPFSQVSARRGPTALLWLGTVAGSGLYSASVAFDGEFVEPRLDTIGGGPVASATPHF